MSPESYEKIWRENHPLSRQFGPDHNPLMTTQMQFQNFKCYDKCFQKVKSHIFFIDNLNKYSPSNPLVFKCVYQNHDAVWYQEIFISLFLIKLISYKSNTLRPRQNFLAFAHNSLKKCLNFDLTFSEGCSWSFVQQIVWHWTGYKQLPKPFVTQYNGAYVCHLASMNIATATMQNLEQISNMSTIIGFKDIRLAIFLWHTQYLN